jgi:hypothetical protein
MTSADNSRRCFGAPSGTGPSSATSSTERVGEITAEDRSVRKLKAEYEGR